jgi:hypothetical protein
MAQYQWKGGVGVEEIYQDRPGEDLSASRSDARSVASATESAGSGDAKGKTKGVTEPQTTFSNTASSSTTLRTSSTPSRNAGPTSGTSPTKPQSRQQLTTPSPSTRGAPTLHRWSNETDVRGLQYLPAYLHPSIHTKQLPPQGSRTHRGTAPCAKLRSPTPTPTLRLNLPLLLRCRSTKLPTDTT